MRTFQKVLVEITRDFVVHYVETREKSSSRVGGTVDYGVRAIGLDLVEVVEALGLEDRAYIAFGASLGATAMIDCYGQFKRVPLYLVLLEPNAAFYYPTWSLPLIRHAAPFYRIARPAAKWYLKNFRVNTKDDYEMYRINCRALDAADPYKLRDAALAISSYQIWDHLEAVRTPSLIVGASKDTFHRHEDLMKVISMIGDSTYLDLEKHERTHSGEIVDRIREYLRVQGGRR